RASLDHARLQLLELLLVVGAHSLEQLAGGTGLFLIDLRDREAHVDEHPVARTYARALGVEQSNVDRPLHPSDVDLREPVRLVHEVNNLAGNGQAHWSSSPAARS